MNNFLCFKGTGHSYVINLFKNMFFVLIRNNMRMNDNVLEASHKHKVKKVGVSCSYPTSSSSPLTFSWAFHNVTKYCDLKIQMQLKIENILSKVGIADFSQSTNR
jgi:hypothetical protein